MEFPSGIPIDCVDTSGDLTGGNAHTVGDGSSGDVVLTFDGDSGTDGTLTWDVSEDYFSFGHNIKLLSSASPTTDDAGEIAFDTNAWASGRGAVQVNDGTASTYLPGVLVTDTPSDGQIQKWHTGGTITWEDDDNSAAITGTDTYVLFFDGVDNPAGDSGLTYNKTTNTLTADSFVARPSATPTTSYTDSDATDGDVSTQIVTNCTDTGSGTEDCDMTISQQIDGSMTTAITLDADGNIIIGRILTASNISAYANVAPLEVWWENPTASDDFNSVICNDSGGDWTFTKISCESDQTVNADAQVDDGTPADVVGSDLSCDSTPATACGSGCDTTIAGDGVLSDGECLDIAITSVSGTPTWWRMTFTYTY